MPNNKKPIEINFNIEDINKKLTQQNIEFGDVNYHDYIEYLKVKSSFELMLPSYKQWVELQRDSSPRIQTKGFENFE